MAGIEDCYTSTTGHSRTMGNFIYAVYHALRHTYGYLTPELWKPSAAAQGPFQEHSDFLGKAGKAHADA